MSSILVEPISRGLVAVTFNRPERRNALNIAMMQQLVESLKDLAGDKSTRVVIFHMTGMNDRPDIQCNCGATSELRRMMIVPVNSTDFG